MEMTEVVSTPRAAVSCSERLPPLIAVAVVCAAHDGLSSLASEISAFIDPAATRRWTVEAASERGDLRLLQRVIAHEPLNRHALYYSFVFSRALVHAVQHDRDVALLECLYTYCPNGFASYGMEAAAACGKVHVVKWISAHCSNIIWSARFLDQAARIGSLPVLQWFYTKLELFPNRLATVIATAIDHRHFDAAQWLLEAAHRDNTGMAFHAAGIFRAACRAGHLETLTLLLTDLQYSPPPLSPEDLLDSAVMSGNLALIEWLYHHQIFCKWSSNAYAIAAQRGHVDVLRWLLAHDDTSSKTMHSSLRDAVRAGTLGALELLYELAPEVLDAYLLAEKIPSAAENGDIAMLRWLLPLIETSATSFAATVRYHYAAITTASSNGHVAVVKWLIEHIRPHVPNPTPLDQFAVSEAAANGHAELAKWIHTHLVGHKRLSYSIVSMAERGRLDLIKWMLVTERATCASDPKAVLEAAARSGDLETLAWLYDYFDRTGEDYRWNGTPRTAEAAAKHNYLHILKWLHAHHIDGGWSADVMDAAASVEVVEWLHWNRTEGCTTQAMDNAAQRGDLETLLFLHAHRSEGCTLQAAVDAHDKQHLLVFQWLIETFPDMISIQEIETRMRWAWGPDLRYWSPLLTRLGLSDVMTVH